MRNNTLIYWKWDDSTLDDSITARIDDLCGRLDTGAVFVALHWIKRPFNDKKLLHYLELCCRELHKRGKKLYVELCPRNEAKKFFDDISDDTACLAGMNEIKLDSNGFGELTVNLPTLYHYWRTIPPNDRVIKAFCLEKVGISEFRDKTLADITRQVSLKKVDSEDEQSRRAVITVNAGPDQAGKTAVVFIGTDQPIPDLASPDLEKLYEFMLDSAGHIPLDGVCSDEWGYDIFLDYTGNNYYEDEISIKHLSVSDCFADIFKERTGGLNLYEELLYMFYSSKSTYKRRINAINSYFDTMRYIMSENDRMMYKKAKEKFGRDTFYGVHPTWWGSETLQYFEFFKNGFYWWDAVRDIAQTDETVIMPVRTALAHKWGSHIWYNMWYSMGTRDINTYYKETWNNILYGGRTHYLGYECPNESVVLELKPEGMLESIEEMDQRIRLLDDKQMAQPDCRVLLLFSMPAAGNWCLDNRPHPPFFPANKILTKVLKTARELFNHYLCDLVPSSEIANGSLRIENGKAVYGTQVYDAVILLSAECLERESFDFIRNLTKINLAVCGSYSMYSDGEELDEKDEKLLDTSTVLYKGIPAADELKCLLMKWGISPMRSEYGTVLQDGSIMYSAKGTKPSGNKLEINEELNGLKIEFKGEDFLFIYREDDKYKTIYPGEGRIKIT